MLSKAKRTELFTSLISADNTDVVEAVINEVNELIECLEACGAITEDGDAATFEKAEQAVKTFEQEYLDLKAKYVERFMSGEPVEPTEPEPTEPEPNSEDTKIDDLFEKESEE